MHTCSRNPSMLEVRVLWGPFCCTCVREIRVFRKMLAGWLAGWLGVEVMTLLQTRWFYNVLGEAEGNVAMTQINANQRKPTQTNAKQRMARPEAFTSITEGYIGTFDFLVVALNIRSLTPHMLELCLYLTASPCIQQHMCDTLPAQQCPSKQNRFGQKTRGGI